MPDWYDEFIEKKIRDLVRLLRNNGWNTESSCGHEYEGVIIIQCYGEQGGHFLKKGGTATALFQFLWKHGYQHFEIKHVFHSWHGKIVSKEIWLRLLDDTYDCRWK